MVTVDYVREANRCANLDAVNPSTGGGDLGKWVKYSVIFFINQSIIYLPE